MGAHDVFILLAIVAFGAASVVGFIQRSYVPALFCLAFAFLVLGSADLINP